MPYYYKERLFSIFFLFTVAVFICSCNLYFFFLLPYIDAYAFAYTRRTQHCCLPNIALPLFIFCCGALVKPFNIFNLLRLLKVAAVMFNSVLIRWAKRKKHIQPTKRDIQKEQNWNHIGGRISCCERVNNIFFFSLHSIINLESQL